MTGDQIEDFVEGEAPLPVRKEAVAEATKTGKADDGHTCLYLNDLNWVCPMIILMMG
jgi:hypothetical protein